MNNNRLIKCILGGVAWLAIGAVAQASISWDFTACSSDCNNQQGGGNYGNTRSYSGSPSATASAWSGTGSGGSVQSAYLGAYSGYGLGVTNQAEGSNAPSDGGWGSPNHSMDNYGHYDSILFSFGSDIALTQVELGWINNDSDISVLAWTGTGAPTMAGSSYANLTSSGWTLVGNYANVPLNSPANINPGAVSSSYWLIGAYNSVFGGGSGLGTGNDYVKIAALYGTTPTHSNQAPEPGVAALVLLGLFIMTRKFRPARAKK